MKKYFIALILLAIVLCQTDQDWFNYKQAFKKVYSTPQEEATRRGYWEKVFRQVEAHNSQTKDSVAGLNDKSDYSGQDILNLLGARYDIVPPASSFSVIHGEPKTGSALPTSVDWRLVHAVTTVKDQGYCGSCWAFTTASLAESFTIIKLNQTYDLSEEYLLECTAWSDCGGGYPSLAMDLALSGVPNETTYPYLAYNWFYSRPYRGICSTVQKNTFPNANATYYNRVTEAQLKTMLINSPVVVSFAADSNFINYQSGVWSCATVPSSYDLNHVVQLIGYDQNGNYIIKNSWGTTWGEAGYATISSIMDCGIRVWVYTFESTVPSKITLNSIDPANNTNDGANNNSTNNSTNNNTTNNSTNDSTNNNTTNNTTNNTIENTDTNLDSVKFEWKAAYAFIMAAILMILLD